MKATGVQGTIKQDFSLIGAIRADLWMKLRSHADIRHKILYF